MYVMQVEHGDVDRAPASPGGSPQPKIQQIMLQVLDRFYPRHYKQDRNIEQLRLYHKHITLNCCVSAVMINFTVGTQTTSTKAVDFSLTQHEISQ